MSFQTLSLHTTTPFVSNVGHLPHGTLQPFQRFEAIQQVASSPSQTVPQAVSQVVSQSSHHHSGVSFLTGSGQPLAKTLNQTTHPPPPQTAAPEESLKKRLWKKFVLLGPIAGMIAGGGLLAAGLIEPGFRMLTKMGVLSEHIASKRAAKLMETLRVRGKFFQAAGTMLVNINGLASGVVAGQPSMLLANALQFPFALKLFTSKTTQGETIANFVQSLLGGVYTFGLANEIGNKARALNNPHAKPRQYDMTHFKEVLNPHSTLTVGNRAAELGKEVSKMVRFSVGDHWEALKSLKQVKDKRFWDVREASETRSQLGAFLVYLGYLPVILSPARLNNNPVLLGIRLVANTLMNLSVMGIAWQRKDARGKTPLLGAPMSILGTAMPASTPAQQAFWRGLGATGEAINNLLYSEVAVDGLTISHRNTAKKTLNPVAA